ncbi:leucine-rich_repeat domain-containing protein [Hexamita inflata]|uniref:Leucine-rich repeat domain-containing protein n=1 Tax=Hexamita inflata TaxID=28002 RepID=A0AA86NGN6_9EUKA|nr:leucine-rich repeat domain-containing protein [Hexamita inflata]
MQNNNDYDQVKIQQYQRNIFSGNLSIHKDKSISSLHFLQFLNVKHVSVWQCENVSLSSIPPTLNRLTVNQCTGVDLSELKHNVQLQFLDIKQNKFSECRFLRTLVNITNLTLINNNLENIAYLRDMAKLNSLIVHQNSLNDITGIQHLKKLTLLNLSYNKIVDISPLESLTNIEELYLNQNQIVSIEALTSFSKLRNLEIFDNYIQDMTPICLHKNIDNWNLYKIGKQQDPTHQHLCTSLNHKCIYGMQELAGRFKHSSNCRKIDSIKRTIYYFLVQIETNTDIYFSKINDLFLQLNSYGTDQ